MPIEKGRYFDTLDEIPLESRPQPATTRDIETPITEGQGTQAGPRQSSDGTTWCWNCYSTLEPGTRTMRCGRCKSVHHRLNMRAARETGGNVYRISAETANKLRLAARAFGHDVVLGSWAYNHEEVTQENFNKVLMQSKSLLVAIDEALEEGEPTRSRTARLARRQANNLP